MPKYIGNRYFATAGKRPATKLTAEEKITKDRLDAINPYLWRHLDAAYKGKLMSHGVKRN